MKLSCPLTFLKWKNPCLLFIQRLCAFALRVICRMSLVFSVFRTCWRPFGNCAQAAFAHCLNWNVFATNVDELTYSRNTGNSGCSFTCHNCSSLNMSNVDFSDTVQSQIWKQMVSFKRKLLGDSSVLPSSVLALVASKSQSVLSQQSNSAQMPDYCSYCSKRPKLEHVHGIMTSDSTEVAIPEDFGPQLMAAQEHRVLSESLDPASLLYEDELVALFDSDNQKETVTTASTSSGKKQRKKRKSAKSTEDKVVRPNYFIAVQITNTDICQRVGEVQECILKQNKLLKQTMIAVPTLHLTLLVMHIADELQLDRAKVALDECCQAVIDSSVKLPTLCISGIDHFQNAVVFAKVQQDDEFEQLHVIANLATDHFKKQDLLSEYSDSKTFHPHLTIMKLSKAPRLRKQGIKKIDRSVYEEHCETFFGHQPVTSLQLCSMTAPKDKKTGYYKVMHQVHLQIT